MNDFNSTLPRFALIDAARLFKSYSTPINVMAYRPAPNSLPVIESNWRAPEILPFRPCDFCSFMCHKQGCKSDEVRSELGESIGELKQSQVEADRAYWRAG